MSKKPCAECGATTTWVRAINDSPICGPYEGCSNNQADGLPKSLLEPQEGGGVAATDSATASVNQGKPGPLPSCDSELAAIVSAVRNGCRPEVADALLRMVEELTANQNYMHECAQFQMRACEAAEKERDDLRAKLEVANIANQMGDQLTTEQLAMIEELRAKLDGCRGSAYVLELDVARIRADRDKWKGKAQQLEAKLAEAEKLTAVFREANERSLRSIAETRERAEAAEARCREYESRRGVKSDDAEAIKKDLSR